MVMRSSGFDMGSLDRPVLDEDLRDRTLHTCFVRDLLSISE